MKALECILRSPVSHPRTVLALLALATLVFAVGATRLRVDSSIESMIVEHDPDRLAFDRWKELFGSDEVVSIALPFDDALAAEALDVQRRIAARVEELPEVAEVEALVTVDDIVGTEDALDVQPLVPPDPADWNEPALARVRERVEANALWTGSLVSRDRRTAALQVRLESPGAESVERGALLTQIERIVEEEGGGRPYFLAGHPFMKTEIARTMQSDLGVLLPATVALMAVLVYLAVGSIAMTGLILAAVLVSVVWMTGFMGWIGEPITALSNTAPTFLLAIGCAYVMHLAASYQRLVQAGSGPEAATLTALEQMRRPVVVAGLTTAIGAGFVALSDLPLVSGFGIDLMAGVISVIVLACFAVPAVLSLTTIRGRNGLLTSERRLGVFLFGVVELVGRRPRVVLAGALVLFAAACLTSREIVVDSSGPRAFAEDSRFRSSSEFYREHFSGDVIENVYVRTGGPGGIHDPGRLRRMLDFQAAAEALPEIDKSFSIANYVELINRAMHGDDPRELCIPDSAEAVAQYLLLYSSAGEPDEFDDLLDFEHRHARIVLTAAVGSSRESAALRARLEALAREHLSAESGADTVLSTEILLSEAADELAVEQAWSLAGAAFLILFLSSVAFRSLWIGAHLFLPIALPVALSFAVMVLTGVTLRDVTSVIAVTTLGIAVDSTVHLLDTIRRHEAAHGLRRVAVFQAYVTTGRPVLVTSLIIAAGLAVLGLSDFQVISNFGGLEALSLLFALAADLFVLPAQLLARGGAGGREPAGEAVLLTTAERAFPALLLARSPGAVRVRVLGDRGPRNAELGDAIEVRGLHALRPIAGRVRASTAEGMELEIALDGAARSPRGSASDELRRLFDAVPTKEFRLDGYRFCRADSIEERQAAYALRFRVYAEHGYIDPADFRSALLRDAHDESAVQCLVYDAAGRLVGTARAVLPSALGYQTEALFDFEVPDVPRERLGEIGRLALAVEHRGGERVALLGLVKLLYDALREHELTHAYAFMPGALIESLDGLGFPSRPLGPPSSSPDAVQRRSVMRGYFERLAPQAVLFDLDEAGRGFGAKP
ncbi:MAG: MMPL family transporter [Myxococcota bacterium]